MFYTSEKHTQILIALLKEHNIKKIVASPGTTSVCLVASLQNDPFFEIFSCVDERSAAFIAVGMAAESGEPVALTCTGSTASRNYLPGLTEAYYRKLPVLAITASQHLGRVGQNYSQVIDRSSPLADIAMESVVVNPVSNQEDEWECSININKALIALYKDGGGPAHINLVTTYSRDFSCKELPKVKAIKHISTLDQMPSLEKFSHIAILVGVHEKWSQDLISAVEDFCGAYNAVVINNHASNYVGNYGYNPDLIINMRNYSPSIERAELVIYIGSVSRYRSGMNEKEMWRVNPDGKIRDIEKKLTHVFALDEKVFFRYYADIKKGRLINSYAKQWQCEYSRILALMTDIPFSGVWIASKLSKVLPENIVLHLAGSNTARAWNYYPISKTIECYSNDGTMGIDGQVSALVGESFISPGRLHFGVVGDLTFFYDMNSLGNRHIRSNLRLLIVNNAGGGELKIYPNMGSEMGDDANAYIAATGHYGNKSLQLIRHYAEDLGFEYMMASTKDEFEKNLDRFTIPEITDKPMIFEVFTNIEDEIRTYDIVSRIVSNSQQYAKSLLKNAVSSVAGEKNLQLLKAIINKKGKK